MEILMETIGDAGVVERVEVKGLRGQAEIAGDQSSTMPDQ